MSEQVCPHCYREITQEDIDKRQEAQRESELKSQFRNTSAYHTNDRKRMVICLPWLILMTISLTTILFAAFPENRNTLGALIGFVLLVISFLGTMITNSRYQRKENGLFNQYKHQLEN